MHLSDDACSRIKPNVVQPTANLSLLRHLACIALMLLGPQLSDLVLHIQPYAVDCGPMLRASSLYGPPEQHPIPCTAHYSLVTPYISAGLTKQPSTPTRQGPSPMARVQAARSFFTSSRGAGCKAGHPQAVLEGLVQALHQLPTDLSQGQHIYLDHAPL